MLPTLPHSLPQGMGLPSQAAATIVGLRADLREAETQHAAQLADLQAGHRQELEALRREHSAMLASVLALQAAASPGPGPGPGWACEGMAALSPSAAVGGGASPSAGVAATVGALQAQQVRVARGGASKLPL